jgi:hypothetical protein
VGWHSSATHLPVLSEVLIKLRPRDIIEVGCGLYSTPILRTYVAIRGGEHFILETDQKYQSIMSKLCGCEIDLFDGTNLPSKALRAWGLAFIDHSPANVRAPIAIELQGLANVIVLHDSNPEWDKRFKKKAGYGYSKIIPKWKYHKHYTVIDPHTLVLTDSDEVWQALNGA